MGLCCGYGLLKNASHSFRTLRSLHSPVFMKIIFPKIFFYLCLSFILGIALSFLKDQGLLVLFIFGLGLFLSAGYCFRKEFCEKQKITLSLLIIVILLMIFSATMGWMRYDFMANPKITQTEISYFNDYPQEVTVIGLVKRVEQRVKNNRLLIQAKEIEIGDEKRKISGKIIAFVHRLVKVNYGDRVKLEGQLRSPQPFNGFNWPMHLANEGIRSVMFRPWVTIIEENQGTFIMSKIYSFNSLLQERINRFLPYPESAILSAMLLGNRGEIPAQISHNFWQIGLGHILAISGLHITIIAAIFFWIALSLGMWRQQAFILISLFLIFFILMIGAPPSAIRAGIMGFLFLLAQYLGREYSFLNAIIFAATGILIFNPLSLFYDISFQFSFAAILAIALLVPIFQRYLYKDSKLKITKNPLLIFFLNIFLISGAILLFIGPLMAYYFGNFPAISPLVNVLVIPLLPFILFFGIIFLAVSLIFPPISLIFSSLSYLFISFLIHLGNFFAGLPFIEWLQFYVPIYFLVLYYLILLIIIYKIKKTAPPFLLLKI